MSDLKIGIIGCGNMGSAILRGLLAKNIASAGSIAVNDKDTGKAESVAMSSGCRHAELSALVKNVDYLIIAVKPQNSEILLKKLSGLITGQTIISVMAGVKISTVTDLLGKEVPVARAMPNMAAVIGESMTCVSFNDLADEKEEVKKIFSSIGRVVEVEEALMDAVTAVSGSGPAYLFYLADVMISAGEKAGLDPDVAKELVTQTLFGASSLLKNNMDISAGEHIRAVASKGGTTEAALSIFEDNELKGIIKAAINRAKQRSEELSGG